MSTLSPAYDNKIARKYSVRTLEHKIENKLALQEELTWPAERKIPVVCIPTGMTDELGGALLQEALPGILSRGLELIILGKGSEEYGKIFTQLANQKGHRIAILEDTDDKRRAMYAAADIALFFKDPTSVPELQLALRYGAVPIAPTTKALENYNPVQESGNAFLYDTEDKWSCFAALVRALETFNFPFDWRTIQRHCMESAQEE